MDILASETQSFKIVADFKDNATKGLKKINRELIGVLKTYRKIGKVSKQIRRDMNRLNRSFSTANRGLNNQASSFRRGAREMANYTRQMRRATSAQRRFHRVSRGTRPGATPSAPTGGGGGRGGGGFMGGVGQVALGNMVASAATSFLTFAFNQARKLITVPFNYLVNSVKKSVDDEMDDVKSAGGIFAIGKKAGLDFADTFEEAVEIQKKLNKEMASLASSLPGETNDYVRTMKQITDSTMQLFSDPAQASRAVRLAQENFNSNVNTPEEAFTEMTKQLAKLITLAELDSGEGTPFHTIVEKLMSTKKGKVKIDALSKFAKLQNDPLLKNALKDFQDEMNSAAAETPERLAAIIKALEQAFPEEKIRAMQNTSKGVFEAMRSSLFDPETGLFGDRRGFDIDFTGVDKMGDTKVEKSVAKFLTEMFVNFSKVIMPVLAHLPKIFEPFEGLLNPLKDLYANAENTASNFRAAQKLFSGFKDGTQSVRAAIFAIAKLAKAFGADFSDFEVGVKLFQKDANLGEILKEVLARLTSSEGLERIGTAIGTIVGNLISTVSKAITDEGGEFKGAGFVSGLMGGFKESGGAEGASTILGEITKIAAQVGIDIFTIILLKLPGIIADMFEKNPVGTLLVLGAVLLAVSGPIATVVGAIQSVMPILAVVGKFLLFVMGKLLAILGVVGKFLLFVGGKLLAILPVVGKVLLFLMGKLLAILSLPVALIALIVVAVAAIGVAIYVFRDKIWGAITTVGEFLLGIFNWVRDKASDLWSAAQDGINSIKDFFSKIASMIGGKIFDAVTGSKKKKKSSSGAKSSGLVTPSKDKGGEKVKGMIGRLFDIETLVKDNVVATQETNNKIDKAYSTIRKLMFKQNSILGDQSDILDFDKGSTETGFAYLTKEVHNDIDGLKTQLVKSDRSLEQAFGKVASKITEAGAFGDMGLGGILGGVSGSGILGNSSAFRGNPMSYFSKLGEKLGLDTTSTVRNEPGDNPNSYHYHGRAIDLSNSGGPTPEMLRAAQYIAETYGANLKELIYTPLGYSIKDGKKVAPYAKENHYDHIHIAWHRGNTKPLLDEMSSMPKGAKIGYANSSEFIANSQQTKMLASALQGSGGSANVTVNINGFNGNSEELAKKVVYHIETAMNRGRQNSIV